MMRTQMLRFDSELDIERLRAARRERFQRGEVHVPERDVLAAALELCRKHPAVAWIARSNTGSGYLLRADQYHALVAAGHLRANQARFMRFGFKGAADLTGMLRGGGRRLEIECKADRGVVSEDQENFLAAVNGGGGLGFVARSISEVATQLEGA